MVIESSGFNDRTWLDHDGHPHTEALRTTERYRRPDFGHLQIDVTLSDPAVYAKPWTIQISAVFAADTEMLEFVCNENTQSIAKHWVGKAADARKTGVKVTPEVLAKYKGTYEEINPRGPYPRVIVITASGDALFGNEDGGGAQQLFAQSETIFTGLGEGVEFGRNAQGVVTHLMRKQVSNDYRFERKR